MVPWYLALGLKELSILVYGPQRPLKKVYICIYIIMFKSLYILISTGHWNLSMLIALLLFFYANYHQYQCHSILASLRSNSTERYSVPRGDWFEWIVVPHYFADILIYVSLCILYQFKNMTLLCGLIWTAVNLSITANQTFLWYQKHFPHRQENRWRIIPGIY